MEDIMHTFGFIGMGNMGYAMLKGVLKTFSPEEIIFTDASDVRRVKVSEELGVRAIPTNVECANNAKYIVLAVKPQVYNTVIKNIQNVITPEHIIISIAPGISRDDLYSKFGKHVRIVRTMPNTPALIGMGMSGVSYDDNEFTFEEKDVIDKFFNSFSRYKVVDEKLLDVVTCVSGSSPAYVYMFIEALADSAVKYGMARNDAYEFAAQTVMGSAAMVLETGEHPGVLKDRVCSPGGTTIAAVAALEEYGFRNSIIKATDKCYEKCTSIKK